MPSCKVPVLTPVLANEVTEQMRRDGVDFTQQDDDVQLHYYSDCKQENP